MAPTLTSNDATISIPQLVLLTPRQEAPDTKGTSEVASSDSGTLPPSSKKAHTPSLSIAMKKSKLKTTNDVKVVDAEVEGATKNEELKWRLYRSLLNVT
jgi:hypothetical protein